MSKEGDTPYESNLTQIQLTTDETIEKSPSKLSGSSTYRSVDEYYSDNKAKLEKVIERRRNLQNIMTP